MAKDLASAPQPPVPPLQPEYTTRVALTPAQQAAVLEHTGREMEYVDIPDDDHELEAHMRETKPDQITIYAMMVAEQQNAWDEEYHAYLVELAAWQDEEEDPVEAKLDAIEDQLEADIEAQQQAIADFYQAEIDAKEAARAQAIEAFDPKGKKRKKGEI